MPFPFSGLDGTAPKSVLTFPEWIVFTHSPRKACTTLFNVWGAFERDQENEYAKHLPLEMDSFAGGCMIQNVTYKSNPGVSKTDQKPKQSN